jgi:Domain of unknown function (DUF4913)
VSPPIGEWDDETADNGAPAHTAASSAVEAAIGRVDLTAAAAQAVGAAMQRRLDAIAAAAVDELLEPLIPGLREAADAAARQALVDTPGAGEDAPPEPYFPDLMTFVKDYLSPMYRRALSGSATTWCPEWWKHSEAIARLEALWRAWEFLRLDPHTGMSVWFRDHADHHMGVLLSSEGPFKGCKPAEHGERLKPLPLTPPPDDRATLR